MKISELGEFGLIDRIAHLLPKPREDVLVGIGDDVAVLRGDGNRVWLATCDVQLEDAHFLRNAITPRELGRKALAINLSDLAGKGGTPRYVLVSLGLPSDLDAEFIDELYTGLRVQAEEFGAQIVGGNISRSQLGLVIDIFLLGEAARENVLLRLGAHVGDKILVTGTLGDAAAGVALLTQRGLVTTPEYVETARSRYNSPTPRVKEGQIVASSHLATAMMDLSDGLGSDLAHICDQSQVGTRVFAEQLPIAPANRALAGAAHGNQFHFALFGGEDYELLFTAPAAHAQELARKIMSETGTRVSVIGEMLSAEEGRQLVLPDARAVAFEARGWDHLKEKR